MFKKILMVLGSFSLVVTSGATVIACGTQKENNDDSQNNAEYDKSETVQTATTNAVDRLKSVVLADQFGLSDAKYWSNIVNYDRTNKFSELFNVDSIATADKQGLNLTGRGGESNILLKELLDTIMNALGNVNIAGIDLGSIIKGALGDTDLDATIDDAGDLITVLPKMITEMPLQQLVGSIALVIELLTSLVGNMINMDDALWNTIAETVPAAIKSAFKNYGIKGMFDDIVKTTAIENYQDFTFEDLTNRLWNSLFTTISYGINANYVTNPDTELNTDNGSRIFEKFSAVVGGSAITPLEGEKTEPFGVVKYAFTTIKILEIYFQFFGEEFFTYTPDVTDWTNKDGNAHLFASDKTNKDYFQNLLKQKVSTLSQVKDGVNLSFFWKVLKTFLGNDADLEHGVMFQKLLNALLVGYQENGDFYLLPWLNLLSHAIDDLGLIARSAVNFILTFLEGLFTNKDIPTRLNTYIGIAQGFVPENIKPYIEEVAAFLANEKIKHDKKEDSFYIKPFDFLWSNDISLIVPSVLTDAKTNLKLEKLNLSGFIYKANLIDLFKLFNVDLSKYGTRFTNDSLAGIIKHLDEYIEIDKLTYTQLNENNLDFNLVKKLLDLLVKENSIKLTAEEDNVVQPEPGETLDNSLLRQLLSNIKNAKVVEKILGLTVTKDGEIERYEVVQDSFLGTFIKFIYPQINSSNAPNYNFDDLTKVQGFNGNFLKAVGNLLTSLLEGTDYTYLIQPLVTNKAIWKVQKVTNIYFPNSGGQLMYQQISLEFDPTGIKLNDGSIVDATHKANYDLTFRRTSQLELYSFTQIIKHRSR